MPSIHATFQKALHGIFGSRNDRELKRLWPLVHRVNELEPRTRELSDDGLRQRTSEFRQRHENGESLDDLLPEAFAVCREAGRRVLKMRHFDVQILGGIVLHEGKIAEMVTGEGKTLVATLPSYLNGLAGVGVHVVTVNDYLARRDREWMGPLHEFLGLKVGCIQSAMDSAERHPQYDADITYATNNELGFDYLRDNMKGSADEQVQKRRNYAIVDEVDSILIDEARTPLIISGPAEQSTEKYYLSDRIAAALRKDEHFEVKEKERHVLLTEEGIEYAERLAGVESFYTGSNMDWPHHIEQALRAHNLYRRDRDYIVKDGEVLIVDEFTGRVLPGRRWSDGLHQAVEAKEKLRIKEENQTLATITFQNFFRLYEKLAGMTGTAATEAAEFYKIYKLEVVTIPTNRPLIRRNLDDVVYRSEREKYNAIVEEIDSVHAMGRPILVGTTSIEKSERLAGMLRRRGIPHEVLNAKHHEREAQIVAGAGEKGRVTIATNMAGRGTDILLGEDVVRKSCLHPDTGETWCCIGCDRPEKQNDCATCFKKKDGGRAAFERCWSGNRMPCFCGSGTKYFNCHYGEQGDWDIQPCGLHVIASERHEARRIDNQLRGRAGRQGDPGSTKFFLSLEDDLMRIFAPEWVSGMLEKIGMTEGQEIQSPMVTRGIGRAQKRVEQRNYEIRKNLLEYDEVMDSQRKIIYERRQEVLEGADLRARIFDMIEEDVDRALALYLPDERGTERDPEALRLWIQRKFVMDGRIEAAETRDRAEVRQEILDRVRAHYDSRERELGEEVMRRIERFILLTVIDQKWKEHLYNMDALREGIGLRGYAQVDPKIEYKREGFERFDETLSNIASEVTDLVFKVRVRREEEERARQSWVGRPLAGGEGGPAATPRAAPVAAVRAARSLQAQQRAGMAASREAPRPFQRGREKVGRNDPCPCGSGKKYKKCCGRVSPG